MEGLTGIVSAKWLCYQIAFLIFMLISTDLWFSQTWSMELLIVEGSG